MYGAILGDIIGSPYEFDMGNKSKEFELFAEGCHFTDDTVMTCAVAEALLSCGKAAGIKTIEETVAGAMRRWGSWYPDAGYGARFRGWLNSKNMKAYGSCGNGSAMRVCAAGWLFDSLWRTRDAARATANVTHNHPEGIKGADAVASAIFMARTGSSKEEIKEFIEKEFHYDLSRTCDQIRPDYHHVETCQETVPQAFAAFLEGNDFEDVIRTAVSLGGDCDTLTCIAGSMAEAFYGVPEELITECRLRVDDTVRSVLNQFDKTIGRTVDHDPERNANLAEEISKYTRETDEARREKQLDYIYNLLAVRTVEDGIVPARLQTVSRMADGRLEVALEPQSMEFEGKHYLVFYTSEKEAAKYPDPSMPTKKAIYGILSESYESDDYEGVIIDPYGNALRIDEKGMDRIVELLETLISNMEKK